MSDRFSEKYGVYHISPLPGLPQAAVCHGFYVLDHAKGKGNGHKLMSDMISSLKAHNYDLAICTTAMDNDAMQRCLTRSGWAMTGMFNNQKTGLKHTAWQLRLS